MEEKKYTPQRDLWSEIVYIARNSIDILDELRAGYNVYTKHEANEMSAQIKSLQKQNAEQGARITQLEEELKAARENEKEQYRADCGDKDF